MTRSVRRRSHRTTPSSTTNPESGVQFPHARLGGKNGEPTAGAADVLTSQRQRVVAAERWLARRLLKRLGDPPVAVVLWNGESICGATASPIARITIHDRFTLLKLVTNPVVGFGDAYADGRLEIEGDLLALLLEAYATLPQPKKNGRWRGRVKANTLRGSQNHIHHHYDIGNDFYKLWLDDELVYTCAYFPTPDVSLEEAQRAKMEYVCRKLKLQPGEQVVEAGCGWGALALYMARNYGVHVKAYNISKSQIEYARARAAAEGLTSRVEFIDDDYRGIAGEFDVFVSVGMLEHVRCNGYGSLREVIDRCLRSDGRGLIHSIGRSRPGEFNSWIERRIFPGAYPPSLREMLEVFEPLDLCVLDVENLRLHYAKTIEHWLDRFEASADAVVNMFDDRFVRAWRLYLTGSLAAFLAGTLQLFQIVFVRPGVNDVPWTRAPWYQQDWDADSHAGD